MDNYVEQYILQISAEKPRDRFAFDSLKRKVAGELKGQIPTSRDLISAYQKLLKLKRIKPNPHLLTMLRKNAVRTLSGVAVVSSLTEPYPCPGRCVYCPQEANMPKSYLKNEPAAARAFGLKFNPFDQMAYRIHTLEVNGHPTEKIEYILKGGTWNAYPLKYQYWFILESFRAANNPRGKLKYKNWKKLSIKELRTALAHEQKKNESATHRIIGLTLETRPDAVTPENIAIMRELGATRIELGLQATRDDILRLNRRDHTLADFHHAMLLLRTAGFKIDLHFIPQLPGSDPAMDVEMYADIWRDPGLKPDMIKIYPCIVVKGAPLYNWYKKGKYTPYENSDLIEAIVQMKAMTPHYARIARLIRDIPEPSIEAGNKITNLREILQKTMRERGLTCQCLRCREIGHALKPLIDTKKPKLFIEKYETFGGTEYFLSFEDSARTAVFAFLRLRLPEQPSTKETKKIHKLLPEIANVAFIRELHTYGQMIGIGEAGKKHSQHRGLGKKLIETAEKICSKNGFKKLAVISGVGVRDYYRKRGFRHKGTYMVKNIKK
ncbi:MAG TPA: tRNA uridine(34) 5-carboxymethylaminomethyl modification radical SAM/GNAT enzyme Elp3 [Candidatus Magasanikbacteria bacterium]|nr:tRNA uridine(34) 5-carboxymethylaminomethyl modification radical SAM/GNAT enzyme Elp3 [Candidatus Magasanikbacteria bacterium]